MDQLNAECAVRRLAYAFPAQIACRLLGNRLKPCVLDPLCKTSEKHGPVVFYSAIGALFFLLFIAGYWIARVTGIALVLRLLRALIYPPLLMVAGVYRDLKAMYDSMADFV
ncbi:MAG: hypothetical protein WA705_24850 [Candidatus Ozemobacteraceae bacterium]